jgi:ADP-heptose:LPS heptosyltransferase
VLSTPFLRNLRNVVPRAFITLVVKPSVYDLVEHCPYVNEVLTYDPGPLQEITSPDRQWRTLRFAARYLWRRRFDVAIVPRWDAVVRQCVEARSRARA